MSKEKYTPRLREKYNKEIITKLGDAFKITNKMRVPKIVKISINMGLGDAKDNKNSLKQAVDELTNITGQKAVITRAKKAISNFKLREGDPVGTKVTLRGNMMYEFLDRLISIATPRIRDFRGFSSKGFDNFGNYNFGITEQIAFPEIDYDKVNTIRGMNLTIVTTAENAEESHALLKMFGFPINDIKKNKKDLVHEEK
ncbi:MAG: 50S ribosomal protein L5 [Candidatus Marinimicrobia bacterium]|nr:50S ribosomal protein L5 [Candidatus Neomarinimicrobiota bacterium]|tara:strand:+ start:21172 stop:21768 length:597 start_codon:yes stop_codon:yes gene_type:complete